MNILAKSGRKIWCNYISCLSLSKEYDALQDSILHSRLSATLIKNNGYRGCIFEYLKIWNKFRVEPSFGQNKPCPDKPLFFQNLEKTQKSKFGMDLEAMWLSKYLVSWTFERIDKSQQVASNFNPFAYMAWSGMQKIFLFTAWQIFEYCSHF